MFRLLFFNTLKGISMYADRSRLLGATDCRTDRFIAHGLSRFISQNPLGITELVSLFREAEATRAIARDCYISACEKSGQTPASLDGPATMFLPTNAVTLAAAARTISKKRGDDDTGPRLSDGEGACIEHLATVGAVAVSAPTNDFEKERYELFAFLHSYLNALSTPLSPAARRAVSDEIEKAQLALVNTLMSGESPMAPRALRAKFPKSPAA